MKEIEVHAWCDGNHQTAGRVEAVIEVRIAINGSDFKVLDLCATHDMELAALFERGGTVPEGVKAVKGRGKPASGGRPKIEGPHLCPICGRDHPTRNAMTKHLRAVHETSIKELAERAQT